MKTHLKFALFLLLPAISLAQVPVDEDGNVIGQYQAESESVLLSADELQELVGPIALYPDDLLAIVLPASAYPLQIVEAARFLKDYENDSSIEPNPNWDDAIVALINYPEVVDLLNEDLDWTLRLGEAVVAQQTDLVSAVEAFRDRAYAAGNLKSDEYQTVSADEGVIVISPAEEDVIYVPYYEPQRVVYYQPRPVYHYYPRAYPVYYYPYAAGHNFHHNYFWGVTTAFTIGWSSHSLHTYHHSYLGHPYYGHSYWNHWYRRPSIHNYNTYYTYNYRNSGSHHSNGDRWHARERRREYVRREGYARSDRQTPSGAVVRNRPVQRPITFRERDGRAIPRAQIPRSRDAAPGRTITRDRGEQVTTRTRTSTGGRITTRSRSGDRSTRDTTDTTAIARTRNPAQQRRQEPIERETRERRHASREPVATRSADRRQPTVRRQPTSQARVSQRPVVTRRAPATTRQTPHTTRRAPATTRQAPQVTRQQPPSQPRRQAESRPARQQSAPPQRSNSDRSSAGKSDTRTSDSRGRSRDRRR